MLFGHPLSMKTWARSWRAQCRGSASWWRTPHQGRERHRGARILATVVVGGLVGALVVLSGSAQAAGTQSEPRPSTVLADVVAGVGAVVGLGPAGGIRATTATTSTTSTTVLPSTIVTTKGTSTTTAAVAARQTAPWASAPVSESTDPVLRRCAQARAEVEASGLRLPGRFEYRCPGGTESFSGDRQHWGMMCAGASLCPNGAYIAINPAAIGGSEARMRHVVAHEICHALDVEARRPADEAAADSCAAAHGFPRS